MSEGIREHGRKDSTRRKTSPGAGRKGAWLERQEGRWYSPAVLVGSRTPRLTLAGLALSLSAALLLGACSDETPPPDGAAAPGSESSQPPRADSTGLPAGAFPFVDVTASSGVSFVHDNGADGQRHYVETMAPGVALFDKDGDGDLDLYVVDGGPLPGSTRTERPKNRLYENRGDGTFDDVTEGSGAGDTAYGMGVTAGDGDGDGDLDLYVLNYGPNVYLRNDGKGRFEALEVGAEDPSWSVSGAFLDYDGDGDLDLYVVNYLLYDVEKEGPCKAGTLEVYCSPEQFPPAQDRLYRNDGQGRFTDVSREAGADTLGRGMGIGVADFDGNGTPDIYVTNDRTYNFLLMNDGGRFTEMGAEAGVGYGPTGANEGGMGVAAGDLTGSGTPAIFLTNFQKEPNRLFVPAGEGFYDDRSLQSGLGFPSTEMVGWGIGMVDVEGDGDLDLAVANGHVFDNAEEFIPGSAFALRDQLFTNDGSGRFEVTDFPGTPHSSRGVAAGDLDGDGDEDLVIGACGGPLRIWRNLAGDPQRFAVVELRASGPNPFAYGSRITARAGSRKLLRQVAGGGSYASQNALAVPLGLGDAGEVAEVEISWPDGSRETAGPLAGGRRFVLRQGEGVVESKALAEAVP